jgi:hypothetical protein
MITDFGAEVVRIDAPILAIFRNTRGSHYETF